MRPNGFKMRNNYRSKKGKEDVRKNLTFLSLAFNNITSLAGLWGSCGPGVKVYVCVCHRS